jgi:hypothetical protein
MMTDKAVGEELLEALAEVRALFPQWRLGQLVANLAQSAGLEGPGGVWEAEDAQLLAAARRLVERNGSRRSTEGWGVFVWNCWPALRMGVDEDAFHTVNALHGAADHQDGIIQ